jgi:hypothetical protein
MLRIWLIGILTYKSLTSINNSLCSGFNFSLLRFSTNYVVLRYFIHISMLGSLLVSDVCFSLFCVRCIIGVCYWSNRGRWFMYFNLCFWMGCCGFIWITSFLFFRDCYVFKLFAFFAFFGGISCSSALLLSLINDYTSSSKSCLLWPWFFLCCLWFWLLCVVAVFV